MDCQLWAWAMGKMERPFWGHCLGWGVSPPGPRSRSGHPSTHLHLPEHHPPVPATRCQLLSVRAEADRLHTPLVTCRDRVGGGARWKGTQRGLAAWLLSHPAYSPLRTLRHLASATSHSRMVQSWEVVAKRRPSGEKRQNFTGPGEAAVVREQGAALPFWPLLTGPC